jgi:hypothetical protein
MNKLNWQRVKDLLAQGRVQISPKEMISIHLGQIQAEYLWFPPPELRPNISEDKNNLQSQNYGRLHQFKWQTEDQSQYSQQCWDGRDSVEASLLPQALWCEPTYSNNQVNSAKNFKNQRWEKAYYNNYHNYNVSAWFWNYELHIIDDWLGIFRFPSAWKLAKLKLPHSSRQDIILYAGWCNFLVFRNLVNTLILHSKKKKTA